MGKKWILGNVESGYTVGEQSGSPLKVHVPKLFPLEKMPSKPKEDTIPISGSCFINDDECKPGYNKSVKVRNFIEIPIASTAKESKAFSGEISHKTKVEIQVQNNDVDHLKITNLYK